MIAFVDTLREPQCSWYAVLYRVLRAQPRAPAPFELQQRLHELLGLARGEQPACQLRSALNNDGTPLQLCLTSSAESVRVRVLADPGVHVTAPRDRAQVAERALARLVLRAPELAAPCEALLAHTLPPGLDGWAGLPHGPLWLAQGLEGAAFAIYTAGRWGAAEERWARVASWLNAVLPTPGEAQRELVAALSDHAELASCAIEGSARANARAKVYFRLRPGASATDLKIAPLRDPAFQIFLERAVERETLPRSTVVLSVGFSLLSGAISDAKIDLCSHCLPRSSSAWSCLTDQLAAALALSPLPLSPALAQGAHMAFLGLAVDSQGARRLAVYLKG